MARTKDNDIPQEPNGDKAAPKPQKRYRLELSTRQLFLYGLGLVLVCSWMFVFGILVGRGIPVVSSKDLSFRASFMRFMGLGKEVPPPPENAAETWESPESILKSLDYYENLRNPPPHPVHPPAPPAPQPASPPKDKKEKEAPADTSNPKDRQTASSAPPSPAPPAPEKPAVEPRKPAPPAPAPPDKGGEHFTLLVSSFRDMEKAQQLVEKLRSKGYTPRIESLNLSGGSHWNRVLVGTFQNREEATRFASEFNRKLGMEGLVIRQAQ